jgi:ribokinase
MRFFSLGDVMVDVVARLDGPLVEGSDSPAAITYVGGGSAANTAAWLAAAGARSTFVGVAGDDLPGRAQVAALAAIGVDVRLRLDAERTTGSCLVLVAPGGERTMVPDPGANLALRESDVPVSEFERGDHLHVSGYALLREGREAAVHALDQARVRGLTVSVGAASSAPLLAFGSAVFLALLPPETILFANEQEAESLVGEGAAGRDVDELAAQLADRAGCRVVVTAGAGGAAWTDGGAPVRQPAEVVRASDVDTTGAGDAFAAGFLAAQTTGESSAASLRRGHELAARACRTRGGRPRPA